MGWRGATVEQTWTPAAYMQRHCGRIWLFSLLLRSMQFVHGFWLSRSSVQSRYSPQSSMGPPLRATLAITLPGLMPIQVSLHCLRT